MNRYKFANITSIIGFLCNIFLAIIKGIFALISNSQSLLADAFNSIGDIFSSIMTYIGNKISSKEADNDHNLGHGKAEYIFSLLISLVMIYLSFTTIKSSILSIINNSKVNYSIYLIIVCLITIITKFILYLITNYYYNKTANILIRANAIDHRNDILVTLTTLISIILSKFGIKYIDGIVGILISISILITGFKLMKESYDVLMDKALNDNTKNKILKIIDSYPEIDHINHFNSTPVGYRYQISFTIFVDGNLSTFESHDIANKLEKEIDKKFPEIYLTVIHVNPMKIKRTK